MRKVALLVVILLAIACKPNSAYQTEIDKVDSLKTVVDLVDENLQKTDVAQIEKELEELNVRYKYLTDNFPDSADASFWIYDVNNMIRIKKTYVRFLKSREKMEKDIEYTQSQLESLKNSLQDEKISPQQAEEYVNTESNSTLEIFKWGAVTFEQLDISGFINDSIQPRLDSIENYLKGLE